MNYLVDAIKYTWDFHRAGHHTTNPYELQTIRRDGFLFPYISYGVLVSPCNVPHVSDGHNILMCGRFILSLVQPVHYSNYYRYHLPTNPECLLDIKRIGIRDKVISGVELDLSDYYYRGYGVNRS